MHSLSSSLLLVFICFHFFLQAVQYLCDVMRDTLIVWRKRNYTIFFRLSSVLASACSRGVSICRGCMRMRGTDRNEFGVST